VGFGVHLRLLPGPSKLNQLRLIVNQWVGCYYTFFTLGNRYEGSSLPDNSRIMTSILIAQDTPGHDRSRRSYYSVPCQVVTLHLLIQVPNVP
jgi:hypothetical protein